MAKDVLAPVPLVMMTMRKPSARRVDQRQPVAGSTHRFRSNARPARGRGPSNTAPYSSRMSSSTPVGANGSGVVGIMVGIADHQRAVGAAHDDQMDAVAQMLALLGKQPLLQRRRRRPLGIAEIADHAEIGHDRRQPRVEALRREPHHVQLAARQPVLRDALGMKRAEIVARTNDDGAGRNAAAAGFEPPRLGAVDDGLAQERHAVALGKKRRQLRNGLARFDADLVRAVERGRKVGGAQPVAVSADLAAARAAGTRRPCRSP